jgi:hypothetical protein
VNKTDKAVKIIEAAMRRGATNAEAANDAEEKTGLSIISGGPEVCYRWMFFVMKRNGKRVLRYHNLYTKPDIVSRSQNG